ncbi:hypothetical protein, partial [Enterobacter hormaechei]|uniref:hypothetical protein n=1 Tax=Enterobacter hormaechei TaxID=158836 RepID=UPI0019534852
QDVIEAYMTEQHVVGRREAGVDDVVVEKKQKRLATDAPDFRLEALQAAGASNRIALFQFDPDNVGQEFGAQGARIVDVALNDEAGAPLGMA